MISSSNKKNSSIKEQASDIANEFMNDEKVQRAIDAGKKGLNKAYETGSRMRDEFMDDYRSEMSDDMTLTSKFGFKMFVYAALLWGSFLTGSLQSMLMIAGLVLIVEKNMQFVKVAVSACILYIFIGFGCDIVAEVGDIGKMLFSPGRNATIISTLYNAFDNIEDLALAADDLLKLFFGFWGLIKSRKGDYFRFKFIENLF